MPTAPKARPTLYDSQGYNIGADEQKYVKDVLGVIGEHFNQNPGEMHEHIHEVWYCVSAANNRFFEADEKMIREIRKKYTTPVMIILTKVDCVDEESIGYLKKAILDKIPDIDIFTYACDAKTADWDDETRAEYVQKNEIIDWALQHLDESLKAGFIPSIKKSLEMKRKYIAGKVIPKYAALAAGAVVTTSVINVPFTDSVPLMALQLKMSYEIIKGRLQEMFLTRRSTRPLPPALQLSWDLQCPSSASSIWQPASTITGPKTFPSPSS